MGEQRQSVGVDEGRWGPGGSAGIDRGQWGLAGVGRGQLGTVGAWGVSGGRWGPPGMSRAVSWRSLSGRRHREGTPGSHFGHGGCGTPDTGPVLLRHVTMWGWLWVGMAKVKLSANNQHGGRGGDSTQHTTQALRPVHLYACLLEPEHGHLGEGISQELWIRARWDAL